MADLIDNPVINSPFAEPQRHFRFTDDGITDEVRHSLEKAGVEVLVANAEENGH